MSQAERTADASNASRAALEKKQNIRSLVCKACWKGPFAHGSFKKTWNASHFYDGFGYTTTWIKLSKSAEAGCNWCQLLVTAITNLYSSETEDEDEDEDDDENEDEDEPRELPDKFQVYVCFPQEKHVPAGSGFELRINSDCWNFESFATPDNYAAKYIKARERIWQISSPATFERASEWLKECTNKHQLCRELLIPHPTLPTRVIDCSDPGRPKLHITSGSQGTYAALSYVWGGPQLHSTRTDNIDTYVRGIELETMPQTIKDAIITTNRLDIRYLWVDSLCILQDSKEDMTHELGQMRRVYRDAYITIVAAGAESVREGFLQDLPAPPPAVPLPFRCPDGKIGVMSLRPLIDHHQPVDTRGWCLQESLLSPRTLTFASHTLQYHCRMGGINPQIFCISGETLKVRLPRTLLQASSPMSLSPEESSDAADAWQRIVEEYSARSITYGGDKLVALSGIAEMFGQVWSTSKYLAGLWQHNLLEELLWQPAVGSEPSRAATYRAPSWSWAAIDGELKSDVLKHSFKGEPACEILECRVELASEMLPFGEVIGGILRLHAVLERVLWIPDESKIFSLDAAVPDSEPTSTESHGATLGHGFADCVEDTSTAAGQVWAIPLWARRAGELGDFQVQGLIVATESGKDGCFRRVGVLESDWIKTGSGDIVEGWLTKAKQEVIIV